MAGEGTKRIIDLTEAAETQSGDYIAIDSTGRGTRKLPAGFMATAEDLSEEQTERRTADATLDGKITAEAQARLDADNALGDQITALDEKTEADAALIQNPTKTLSGALVSFTDGADMPMVACTAEIVPKQSGSGTPSPSNVRPISGWESVSVDASGVNIWNEEWEYRSGAIRNVTPIPLKPNTTYFLKAPTGTSWANVYCLDANGNDVKVANANATFTTTADTVSGRLVSGGAYGTTYNHDISINYPSTDTEYHAYNGTTTPVNLGRTVYGGTLDVVSGVLTVDRAYHVLSNAHVGNPMGYKAGYAKAYIGNELSPPAPSGTITDIVCNMLVGKNVYSLADSGIYIYGTGTKLGISVPFSAIDGYSDIGDNSNYSQAITKFLTDNQVQIVYPLATPQTYTLTGQEVSTLLGDNNVWADSGDVEITYRRDISIVINNLESALNG